MSEQLRPEYNLRSGSTSDRALLVRFMQQTYQDIFPDLQFSHLAQTVDYYLSVDTPIWWVDWVGNGNIRNPEFVTSPIGCLWMGNAIDQLTGERHAHLFLLYVAPEHRRRGIGTALLQYAQNWAVRRGDKQIGLQVFLANQPALNLYQKLGFQTQSLWMVKPIGDS